MNGGEGRGSVDDGLDEDTEVYTESELALFAERGRLLTAGEHGRSAWARLVSVNKSYANIEIVDNEVSVGRSDLVKTGGEENLHVSKIHCKIWFSLDEELCCIQNLSVNGTLVQGVAISKDQRVTLHHGDEVCLGPETSGCPTFVFQLLNGFQHGQHKRGSLVEVGSAGTVVKDGKGDDAPSPKRIKVNEDVSTGPVRNGDFETFKCSICLNIWHDVVSVTPCLHSFCNACFSNWCRKSRKDRIECRCPQCRANVTSVGRNHMLRGMIEKFLEQEPSLRRTPEERIELDKLAIFDSGHEQKFNFGRVVDDAGDDYSSQMFQGDGVASTDQSSDEEDEDDRDGCIQCPNGFQEAGPNNPGRFFCLPGQNHLECTFCGCLIPERHDIEVAQKCQLCSAPFCKTYFRSQNMNPEAGMHCSEILPLNQLTDIEIPSGMHQGNTYEKEVTRRYMMEQGLSVQGVLVDWLRRLDSGEADQPPFNARVTSASAVCNTCAEMVFIYLLDKFRIMIPRMELPPDAAGRPDCWYGFECRTQFHKDSHARKLNHVCEPTRQSTQRGLSAVHIYHT